MSYIRATQDSQYVEIPDGSNCYYYSDGSMVCGFGGSYGEFIDALCQHAERADFDDVRREEFQRACENRLGEPRGSVEQIGPRPEMAHIIAQFLDHRLDSMELKDSDLSKLNEHAQNAYQDCVDCGEKHREFSPFMEQRDRCNECHKEYMLQKDVSADISRMREYFDENVPKKRPPDDIHDDQMYAELMRTISSHDGEKAEALNQQLGQVCDEIQEACIEERGVDCEFVRDVFDDIHEE